LSSQRLSVSALSRAICGLASKGEINEASLDTLEGTGANFIRLTVNGWIWYVKKAPNYITAVDTVISWARRRGIMVVLDNHAPWYDMDNSVVYKDQIALTIDPIDRKNFMVELAQRYKNNPTVIGFDMLNEPRPVSE
jgi:endoglucanase